MDRLTFTTILALTAGVIDLVTGRNRRQIDRIPDGMVILCQPPGRRYVLYALGAVTVALVLVFSVLYFLDGAPGIYSARFAGEGATDKDRNAKLLSMLEGVPFDKRTARYVCSIAIVYPSGEKHIFTKTCEGYILEKEIGDGGFGYDPLFYFPEFKTTLANVPLDTKNTVSHRSKALGELKKFLADKR